MKLLRNQKGFTLIELVIVLVILGILGAVAMLGYTDLSTQARTAALEGAFGSYSSQLAIAIGVCRGLPVSTGAVADTCGPADFAGNFLGTVHSAVGVTGNEIVASAYTPGVTGTFNICSGSMGNGMWTTVTYDPAATPQLSRTAPAAWGSGATCNVAAP